MTYKKTIDTIITKSEGKYFICSGGNRFFCVNEIGARIFDLCNGKNTESDICIILSNRFNISVEEIEHDITEYLVKLEKLKILQKVITEVNEKNNF